MKSLVMLGGGIDSTVLLAMLRNSALDLLALHVDFGIANKQKEAAEKVAKKLNTPLRIVKFDVGVLHKIEEDTKDWRFYPGYGQLLMTLAYSVADQFDCGVIYTGEYDIVDESVPHSLENEDIKKWNFSKKRLIWDSNVSAWDESLKLYKKLYSLNRMQVCHPFAGYAQENVIQLGMVLKAPFELTMSCVDDSFEGIHCGHCVKCQERMEAFKKAGCIDEAK